jgi:hypothetical protein
MNHPKFKIIKKVIGRKLAVLFLITVSAVASFATLGDGNKRGGALPKKSLLSSRTANKQGSFTLRSGYTYRGNQVINATQPEKRYIRINTVVTMQKGNTTYLVPLRKKVGLGNIKIDIGNRQFQRN